MTVTNVYRDGKVHVCARLCETCIFRPGNLMHLDDGRVEGMVADAGDDGCIPCHSTLHLTEQAVCRGYYDQHPNQTLRIARRLNAVTFDTIPDWDRP